MLDYLLVGLPLLLVWLAGIPLLTSFENRPSGELNYAVFLPLTVVLVATFCAYFVLMLRRPGTHNGQTWGKQILNVRVVRRAGTPVTGGVALMREILGIQVLGMLPFYALADAVAAFCNQNRQTLHDLVASTVVVDAGPRAVVLFEPAPGPLTGQPPSSPHASTAGPASTSGTAPADPLAAGWYPDPSATGDVRWWDGSAWTDQTQPDQR